VLRDASAAYAALRSGRQPSFAPAPAFREYLAWLREQDHAGAGCDEAAHCHQRQ